MKRNAFLLLFLSVFLSGSLAVYAQKNPFQEAGERISRNDIDGAIQVLTSFIESNPRSVQGYSFRANARSMKGDLKGAVEDLSKAVELAPSNFEPYYQRANFKTILGDFQGALEDYNSAMDKGAQGDRILTQRAALKRALNDKDGALKDYEMAVRIRPHSIVANTGYARLLKEFNQEDKAISLLETLLAKVEQDWKGEYPLPKMKIVGEKPAVSPAPPQGTSVKITQGEQLFSAVPTTREEAEKQAAQTEQFLNLPSAYSLLASFYEEKDDLVKAEENIDRAFALKSRGSITFYDVRARIRFKQRNYEDAASDWSSMLTVVPPYPNLYLERGAAFYMAGKEKEAATDFDKYLQMAPTKKENLDKKMKELETLKTK